MFREQNGVNGVRGWSDHPQIGSSIGFAAYPVGFWQRGKNGVSYGVSHPRKAQKPENRKPGHGQAACGRFSLTKRYFLVGFVSPTALSSHRSISHVSNSRERNPSGVPRGGF